MVRPPLQLPVRPRLTAAEIERAQYVGSPEHKAVRWWGGLPGARLGEDGQARRPKKQQTTICPLIEDADREQATCWVRAALRAGQCKFLEADKDFPKHIWYFSGGQNWIGFCINSVAGHYKGWPVDEEERRAIFG